MPYYWPYNMIVLEIGHAIYSPRKLTANSIKWLVLIGVYKNYEHPNNF